MQRGVLPVSFRTSLCSTALASQQCPLGSTCFHAHSLRELRATAAVAQGELPADYKMSICPSFQDTGALPRGIPLPGVAHVTRLRVPGKPGCEPRAVAALENTRMPLAPGAQLWRVPLPLPVGFHV